MGAIIASRASQKSMRLPLTDRLVRCNPMRCQPSGDRRGRPVQAEHIRGRADPLATVAFSTDRNHFQYRIFVAGFEMRRHNAGKNNLDRLPDQFLQRIGQQQSLPLQPFMIGADKPLAERWRDDFHYFERQLLSL